MKYFGSYCSTHHKNEQVSVHSAMSPCLIILTHTLYISAVIVIMVSILLSFNVRMMSFGQCVESAGLGRWLRADSCSLNFSLAL